MFAQLGKQLLILLAVRLRRGTEWVESLLRENETPAPDAEDAASTGVIPDRKGPPAHWLALVREHAPQLLRPATGQEAHEPPENPLQPNEKQSQARTLLKAASTMDGPSGNKPHSKISKVQESPGKKQERFSGEEDRSLSGAVADEKPVLGTEAGNCHPSAVNKYPPKRHAERSPTAKLPEFPEVKADSNPEVLQVEQIGKPSREPSYSASATIGLNSSVVRRESRASSIASKDVIAGEETEVPLSLSVERSLLFANGEAEQSGSDSNARNLQHAVHHGKAGDQAIWQHGRLSEAGAGSDRSTITTQSRPESLPVDGSSAPEKRLPFADFPSEGERPFIERNRWPEIPDEVSVSGIRSVEDQNNRWPEIPEASFQEETTVDVLWAVDHQAKLNREQRGEAWSGLPF